jgi:long-chain acyl-CoA synthetase
VKLGVALSANAQRYPDRSAVVLGERTLTFRELDKRSNALAHGWRAAGLVPGDRVIVYVGNSIELVELVVGVWKAGGIAVPITTWIVGQELGFMVNDCEPFALVYGLDQQPHVDEALRNAPGTGTRTMLIDANGADTKEWSFEWLFALGAGLADQAPDVPVGVTDALIGYTSGTTGSPKGAVVTHANLISAQHCMTTYFEMGLGGTYLVSTPIAHRVGMTRLVSCCVIGATLVVMPQFNPAQALELIDRHQVTVLGTVPTVCRLLLEEMERSSSQFESVRFMAATGEAFPVELKHRLFARLPNLKLLTLYGITEGGAPCVLRPDEQLLKPTSVGRPVPGVEMKLIDSEGGDVPQGGQGEILIRSGELGTFMVCREYFRRPQANAASFTDGWFHSGDVGRFDDEQFLYIVDRVKDMIISGGLNVYSREVEQAIESFDAVREVAVVGRPDPEFGESVVAFVALRPERSLTEDEIIARCRERLASYKKPKQVYFFDSLPRNASGKVLKSTLREQLTD